MITYRLKITLLSDAEPGTGVGTELLNGTVPRDPRGAPYVPASHIKGLLRDRLESIADLREWPSAPLIALLGESGSDGDDGTVSALRIADARRPSAARDGLDPVMTITRTAIGRTGTARANSLRTVEAVRCGESFAAEARLDAEPGGAQDLLARLGFLTIDALGGGRNRGAGRCRIDIEGETRKPGEILAQVDPLLATWTPRRSPKPEPARTADLGAGPAVWLRLRFVAESPICCPEHPSAGNVIRTGPVVPASSVQGAILTLLDRADPDVATACLRDARFRAWPLVPVGLAGGESSDMPFGVRVDLAHRMSKLPKPPEPGSSTDRHEFADAAVDPGQWSRITAGSPLKSTDGVLLRGASGVVKLWRAQDIPRIFQTHGVHHDPTGAGQRGLYSVEALAPLVFTGMLTVPESIAERLTRLLGESPWISLGKSRSVRGGGRLSIERMADPAREFAGWSLPSEATGRVFVVQSPLVLPDDYAVDRAESALEMLAMRGGWGPIVLDEAHQDRQVARTQAHCGVRFGWNRHGIGESAGAQKRLRARRVILPGSVLVLRTPLPNLLDLLVAGLGEGREQGFGALLPHPGIAVERTGHQVQPDSIPVIRSRDDAGRLGRELWADAGGEDGPAPSQIAAVARRIRRDPKSALDYLKRQKERPPRIWAVWKPVLPRVIELVDAAIKSGTAAEHDRLYRALRVWQDLAVADRREEER